MWLQQKNSPPKSVLYSCSMSSAMTGAALEKSILHVCESHPVTLAYLFGSHAMGRADSESDVDIAVLAPPELTKEERHQLKIQLALSCTRKTGLPIEKIDVVILQDVPVLLQLNVIRRGKLLFAKDPGARGAFEIGVEQAYDDERPYLERETDLTLQRILSHKL